MNASFTGHPCDLLAPFPRAHYQTQPRSHAAMFPVADMDLRMLSRYRLGLCRVVPVHGIHSVTGGGAAKGRLRELASRHGNYGGGYVIFVVKQLVHFRYA